MKNINSITFGIAMLFLWQFFSCSDNHKDGPGRAIPASLNYINISFFDKNGNDLSKHLKTEKVISPPLSTIESVIDSTEYKFKFYVDDREIEETYLTNKSRGEFRSAVFIPKPNSSHYNEICFWIWDWGGKYEENGKRMYTIKYTFKFPTILGPEEHTIICKKTASQLGYQSFSEVLYDGNPIRQEKGVFIIEKE